MSEMAKIHFPLATEMREWKRRFHVEAEKYEEAKRAVDSSRGPAAPVQWVTKSVDSLKPDSCHPQMTAVEFAHWKKKSLGWGELSHFSHP